MPYFNYHATVKKMIAAGKLRGFRLVERHGRISPALLLFFEDERHPVMPIRESRFAEYEPLLREWQESQDFFDFPT